MEELAAYMKVSFCTVVLNCYFTKGFHGCPTVLWLPGLTLLITRILASEPPTRSVEVASVLGVSKASKLLALSLITLG